MKQTKTKVGKEKQQQSEDNGKAFAAVDFHYQQVEMNNTNSQKWIHIAFFQQLRHLNLAEGVTRSGERVEGAGS